MKQGTVYAILATLALATPAVADPMRLAQYEPHVLPPHAVIPSVRSIGIDPIDHPVRRGRVMYVMHGIDRADREVRVLIDGRTGAIVSVTPMIAYRAGHDMPPGPGMTMGPYQRITGPNYVAPDSPRVYQSAPPTVYDDEPPRVLHGMRPPGDIPNSPPRVITATPNPLPGPHIAAAGPPAARAIDPPVQSGMLPPPPDRFPQRAAPQFNDRPAAERPKPVRRAAEIPRQAPLPKPRPASPATPPQGEQPTAKVEAAPAVSAPAATTSDTDAAEVPN